MTDPYLVWAYLAMFVGGMSLWAADWMEVSEFSYRRPSGYRLFLVLASLPMSFGLVVIGGTLLVLELFR